MERLSVGAQLDAVVDVFVEPSSTADEVYRAQPLTVAVVLVVLLGMGASYLQTQVTLEWMSGQSSVNAFPGGLLRSAALLALLLAPVIAAAKILFVSYVAWSVLVFVNPRSYRETTSAILHAELPLIVGALANAVGARVLGGGANSPGPDWSLSLGLLFPSVPATSPPGVILSRVTPFVLIWVYFLYRWLRSGDRIKSGTAVSLPLGAWTAITSFQVLMSVFFFPQGGAP